MYPIQFPNRPPIWGLEMYIDQWVEGLPRMQEGLNLILKTAGIYQA